MKKNFFKKLALVLALVLTVTSLNYVPASAAATPAWKAKKSVISLMNRYAYGVKNVPSKGKVTWKTGNTKVAKVSQKGSLVAVGEGTTTLKATVKNKAGKTVKTLTQKVTVKAPVWTATKDTLKEGERTTFTKQYTATGAKVKFASSNTEVAKVSQKGSVLAVKAGKATITATFSMNGEEYATLTKDVTVEAVETAISAVAQKTTTKLEATFVGDTKDVKAENFSIVRADNVVVAVKSVTVDKTDATKVVIETYAGMKDGKEYTVSYKGNVESSAKFTATEGTVADLNVTPVTVTAGKATKVSVETVDANAVVLGTYTVNDASANNIDFSISTTAGYMDGEKLYLAEVGNTATATVVYHTYKYDEKGNEIGTIKKEVTITAVKDATVVSNFAYTIADKTPAWGANSFKANTTIAADQGSLVFFNIKDSAGDEITDYENYKVATSDASKLIINETALTNKTTGIDVKGVAAGTAYILVKDKDNKVLTSLPVTVTDAKKLTSIVLDAASVTVSTSATAKQTKDIKVTAKDQFGSDLKVSDGQMTVECTKGVKDGNTEIKPALSVVDGKIKVEGGVNFTKAGTYVYKLTIVYNNVTVNRTFTVVAKDATGSESYGLEVIGLDNTNSVDLNVAEDSTKDNAAKNIEVKIALLKGGVVADYVTAKDVTVKTSAGKVFASGAAATVDLSKANATASGTAITKVAEAGTYTIEATFNDAKGNEKVLKKVFTVKDTQKAPVVTVKKTDVSGKLSDVFADDTCVEVSYDGVKLTSPVVTFEEGDIVKAANGSTCYVKYAHVQVPVNKDVTVTVKVAVNKSFTGVTF